MRQAQKSYFKHGTKSLLVVAKAWEDRVDAWLEANAQDEIKYQLFSEGRAMPELPGVYNVRHDEEPEEKS